MIHKKRIHNLNNYLLGIKENETFFITKRLSEIPVGKLNDIGFSNDLEVGHQILPKAIGPISRFNSDGKFIKLKHLPMEKCFRNTCLTDWHGGFHFVDIPYFRYPRKQIAPPCVEITIVENGGELYATSPKLDRTNENNDYNLHVFNLFLELFDSCEIFDKNMASVVHGFEVKRVNWVMLPPGEYPWNRLSEMADKLKSKSKNKALQQSFYMDTILNLKPSGIIYGMGGFRGYIAFRFPGKNMCILENALYGNATYIFNDNWEKISQLTKAEIINGNLMIKRLEHRIGWKKDIEDLFK